MSLFTLMFSRPRDCGLPALVKGFGLCILVALLPRWALGAEPTAPRLELKVTERAKDPELARAVQDFLDDHVTRLPTSRFISTNEAVEPDGQSSPMRLVYWSPHVARVLDLCKRSDDCEPLLHRQRIEFENRLGEKFAALAKVPAAEEEASLIEVAILATALDGLESIARNAGKASAPYNEAYPQVAIRMWRTLGNFALARTMQKDMDFMNVLLQTVKPASKPEFSQLSHIALNFELLQDDVGAARDLWAMFSMIAMAEGKTTPALYGLAEAARLEATLGRPEKALGWIAMFDQLAEKLQSQGPVLPVCGPGRARAYALALIAAGRGEFAEGLRLIKALSQAGCGVVVMTLELSLLALKGDQEAVAGEGLSILRQQCAQVGKCFDSHKQRLAELQALLNRDTAGLQKSAQSWLRNLQMAHPAGAQERLQVWVLAQTLAKMPGQQGLAYQLYAALDDVIDLERELQGATANGLNNLARYDGLRRARLLADFRADGQVDLEKFEALRGQNLLKKLQRARWAQDFAGQEDPEARRTLEAVRTSLQPMRAFFLSLAGQQQFGGFLPTLEQSIDEIEKTAQDNYFARLANIKMGFRDARSALQTHESNRRNFGTALKEDEAHLSWLKVQGGYLGILRSGAARRSQFDVPDQVVFAAGGEGLDETLVLYRELLQAGAGATRGARNHDAGTGLAGSGLALKGVPVWRLPKGGFIASRQAPEGAGRAERLAEISEYLFGELIAPFMKTLAQSKRLSISPDGGLALLPFETLSTEGKPLQAFFSVSYVQSLRVFFELQQRMAQRKSGAASRVLSMADPVFPASMAKEGEGVRGVPTTLVAGPSWTEAAWPALPGTRAEADALAKIYPGMSRLQGREASKKALLAMDKSGELKNFRILHFATHGYVDAERSALVLSYPSRTAEAYLFDEELARLNITSELSILSACNTGLGREVSGDGVIGLPFALFMAGNLNTLMTLWSVDDEGTAQFIPAYLQRVKNGSDMISALKDTKLAFAAGEFGERNRDPRIWAPFVIYGAAANGR